jgi:hypothetical protein
VSDCLGFLGLLGFLLLPAAVVVGVAIWLHVEGVPAVWSAALVIGAGFGCIAIGAWFGVRTLHYYARRGRRDFPEAEQLLAERPSFASVPSLTGSAMVLVPVGLVWMAFVDLGSTLWALLASIAVVGVNKLWAKRHPNPLLAQPALVESAVDQRPTIIRGRSRQEAPLA